jgi:RHS repeat-associated protein
VAWNLVDRQGSVRDIMDDSGSLMDHLNYSGYGVLESETDPGVSGNYTYAGGWFAPITGDELFGRRWYDAATGDWLTVDPTTFGSGTYNLRGYTGNDPTNATDPSGEDVIYALDPTAVGGRGHAALIIGPVDKPLKYSQRLYDKASNMVVRSPVITSYEDPAKAKDNYILISVDYDETIFNDGTWANFLPGREGVPIKLQVYHFENLKDLLSSKMGKRYTVLGIARTTKETDHKVLETVGQRWENAGYRLLWRNCSNLALDALREAGVINRNPIPPSPVARAKWLAGLEALQSSKDFVWAMNRNGDVTTYKDPPITKAQIEALSNAVNKDFEMVKKELEKANRQIRELFGM